MALTRRPASRVLAAAAGLALSLTLAGTPLGADDGAPADDDSPRADGFERRADWRFPDIEFKVGASLDQLVLPDVDGEPFAVRSLRGKKFLLHVFASW